jgi:hypothetical protein
VEDQIRVLRIIEYTGERDAIERTLAQSVVKGTYYAGAGMTIRSAILGDYPEILGKEEPWKLEE